MAICVWNSNTKKELQFSRACMSAQITHSMPPLAVLRSQQAQWEAQLMLQDYTWELLQLPLTSLWSASHLPGTVPAVTRWYGLGESIWEWQKGSNELTQSAHQLSKTDFCQPPDRFIPMQHTWIQHRADCCPATNKAFQAWGSVLGLPWSQPRPEGTADTTKHDQCWGSPLVLCFTAASIYFNKGLTCSEDIFHAHLFFFARFLCNLKRVD